MQTILSIVLLEVSDESILEKVHTFYQDSWNNLIAVFTVLGAIVGIGIPIFLEVLRNRQTKRMDKENKEHTNKYLKRIEGRHIRKINEEVNQQFNILKVAFDKEIAESKGSIFHLQGNNLLNKGDYPGALSSFLAAIDYYIAAENEWDLKKIIESVYEDVLTKIFKKNLDDDDSLEESYKTTLKNLEEFNTNDRYREEIDTLKKEFKKAKIREVVAKPPVA